MDFVFINEILNLDYDKKKDKQKKSLDKCNNLFFNKIENYFNDYYQAILVYKKKIKYNLLISNNIILLFCNIKLNTFKKDFINSFHSEIDIDNQFSIDIMRSNLLINKNVIHLKKINSALNYINYKFPNTNSLVKMCCTQAILAPIFEWISNSIKPDYYLSELGNYNKPIYYKKSLITIENGKLVHIKQLRIFKLINGSDYTTNYLFIKITIENIYNNNNNNDTLIEIINVPKKDYISIN